MKNYTVNVIVDGRLVVDTIKAENENHLRQIVESEGWVLDSICEDCN